MLAENFLAYSPAPGRTAFRNWFPWLVWFLSMNDELYDEKGKY